MPTRRTQIVDALVSDIHTKIARIDSANVKRQMVFLNEVNDFPFVTMMVQPETRFHYGAGRKLATLALQLRGYVFDGDSGENIDLAEDLGIAMAPDSNVAKTSPGSLQIEKLAYLHAHTFRNKFTCQVDVTEF